jgi:hypothetical protein
MAKEEKPRCTTCSIELLVNHICLQNSSSRYIDEFNKLNIPNTLDAALVPNADTIYLILTYFRKCNFHNLI